ncbi:MAG: hypothetical protein PHY30_01650 [Candidatus Pacebacteria bacterium]|nr:hypothetical protein [Candidatus Paceibacterota bacterium]
MITDRQKKILNVIVNEYIKSAEPVSSQILSQKYDFGLCSATMRIEMKNLTDFGFLEKPYISSGRVPTDKAYRIFVDEFFSEFNFEEELSDIFQKNETEFDMARELTNFLANMSSNYIIASFPERKLSWQAGLNDIIKEPEFQSKDFIINFLSFIEELNDNQEAINLESRFEIFIGNENPFQRGRDFTLICSENMLNNKERFRLSLIGPKRMDYYKNINLINSLIKTLEEKI